MKNIVIATSVMAFRRAFTSVVRTDITGPVSGAVQLK